MLRITPVPAQRGQAMWLDSASAGCRRWRDNSNKPNLDNLPICTRARSRLSASFSVFSTSRWCLASSMSMKSITTKPPKSRRRIWRATSSAASILVRNAVSSMSAPRVERAEFTSTDTKASVWSITIAPPLGSVTSRENTVSICCSICKRENSGIWSSYSFSLPKLLGIT